MMSRSLCIAQNVLQCSGYGLPLGAPCSSLAWWPAELARARLVALACYRNANRKCTASPSYRPVVNFEHINQHARLCVPVVLQQNEEDMRHQC
jgi:hypothetical protein